ncbi:ER glycosyl hydrolase [Coccidioides immitis RS]|uniref:alpha-1,2-Mannosidase n=1 Tax=Coccidioides immitis (strain RS) TaxID=246410 RepID=A0A0E1RWF4_COCIM|nr:ER glycosyl hydrolase [Coccidioides immitis RS]EAS29000.2 ER glycosyl hydrolase [Coccidioides immitis RS]
MRSRCRRPQMSGLAIIKTWVFWALALLPWLSCVQAMRESRIAELRAEAEHMFYHGFDNYMKYAFPEDELRPLSCGPLTRDRENPAHIELNDVLGNYSLTLVDSLSTLAILSDAGSRAHKGWKAWKYFQDGVKHLVELYGDGSNGAMGTGSRGKGFDADSKVQVFETVIRGLGGLLSAHLFAVGDLPIRGYHPPADEVSYAKLWNKKDDSSGRPGIRWANGFVYDGQLLRLAMDLGTRLLPAFFTATGLPYPRVNLRHGVPFYPKSPLNANSKGGTSRSEQTFPPEITETCSAGAGSLVLEFTVLSRLTGDGRFEEFAKRAFWSVWARRSEIGLIGAGIDAESGKWVNSYTGIGAGIDSFFEYALKSHILLSEGQPLVFNASGPFHELDGHFTPLSEEAHSPDAFLKAWQQARHSIKHHLYRGSSYQYPHYIQGDIITGATRAFWMDSLSAYFPGLLTLSGDLDGATEAHLLTTALWTRFSSLPERWNIATGDIEGGLTWWGGRPEFIESTYYLYRATEDPWYLHVGEMAMRDIKRRCWTKCGWAGLQDVRTGELSNRMESFFLGETAKYLFLLFDPSHPLNHLDSPFVFTTEGHPLVIPKSAQHSTRLKFEKKHIKFHAPEVETCPRPHPPLPFGLSTIAARSDVFHAASLARLPLMPPRAQVESAIVEYSKDHPSITLSDLVSPSNYTYFPWTLPPEVVPPNATSAPMATRPTLDLSFPPMPNTVLSSASLERVADGIWVKSMSGLRLGMIQDMPLLTESSSSPMDGFRIQVINNIALGKDEKVYLSRETVTTLEPTDPNFTQVEDLTVLDIVIDLKPSQVPGNISSSTITATSSPTSSGKLLEEIHTPVEDSSNMKFAFSSFMSQVTSLLRDEVMASSAGSAFFGRSVSRVSLPALTATGKGAVPLADVEEATLPAPWVSSSSGKQIVNRLAWSTIYLAGELCDGPLPSSVPRTHQVIVIKRGSCSFSKKLRNIPGFRPTRSALQLVIVVSYPQPGDNNNLSTQSARLGSTGKPPTSASKENEPPISTPVIEMDESWLVRPLLDEMQVVADGIPRPHPISMVMVGGGDETYDCFKRALGVGIRKRYEIRSQGVPISNLFVV